MATFQQQLLALVATVEAKKRSLDEIILALRKAALDFDGKEIVTLDGLRQEAASRGGTTYVDRIIQFFRERSNEAATIAEIAEAVGGKSGSINNVMYTTHREMFVSERITGFRNKLCWRMTEDAFQKICERNTS